MTLAEQIADAAQSIVDTLTHTRYEYAYSMNAETGVYDCDCNGFVFYVLSLVAPDLLTPIAGDTATPPLAHAYFEFFASLTPASPGAWQRVDKLTDLARGDILAWRAPTIETGQDTGHVVIIAEPASLDASGAFYVVRVYDAAVTAHFADTRAPSGQPSAKGSTGVGSGFINVRIDGEGRPLAYLFAPPLTAQYSYRPIAVGRPAASG